MTEVFAADDYPIASVPSTPLWSENYAFTCFDPAADVSLITLLGRWWGDPQTWRELILLALPGGRTVSIKNYGRAATATVASACMFRVEIIRPGQSLRLIYDGPASEQKRADLLTHGFRNATFKRLRFQIDFEGLTPVWDMSGHTSGGADVSGSLHIEQVGAGNGFVDFGGEHFDIRGAFMNRDHSRGVRNLAKFHRHCWAQGWFPEQAVSFNVYAVALFGVGGLALSNATVSKGDMRYPAEVVEVELINGPGDAMLPYHLTLRSELGEMRLVNERTSGSLLIGFTSPWEAYSGVAPDIHAALTLEEAVHWDWDDKKGIGWSERAFNPAPFATSMT